MSKKIISYALMLVMAFSVIAMPAQTFATTESVSAGAAYSNGTATASEVKVATPKN